MNGKAFLCAEQHEQKPDKNEQNKLSKETSASAFVGARLSCVTSNCADMCCFAKCIVPEQEKAHFVFN